MAAMDRSASNVTGKDDKWRSLLLLILRDKIYRKLIFWRRNFKFLSAHDLTQTLYDQKIDKGGGDIFLDMKELVLNDQDLKKSQERKVKVEVFDSDFACFIDGLLLLNVSMTMVVAPFTFLWDGHWHDPSSVPGGRDLLALDLCLDICYALYLLLMLEMSYLHPESRTEIVTRRRVIRSRLRSPLYWLKWLSVSAYLWAIAFDAPLVINISKLIRGGVFIELPDSLWRLRDTSEVRLAKPIILLMGVAHWVASFLFNFGGYLEALRLNGVEASETSFRGQVIDGRISSYFVAYVEALYMLTGALDGPTGDGARDGNFGALIIVVIFVPIGQLVVSLFISAILQEQDLKNALDKRHNENKAFIQRAVQILGIPKELQRRVFSMHYFQKMSHDIEAFQILFDGKKLSPALCSSLKVHLYQESVLSSDLLKGKDANYIIEVLKVLQDVVCLPGEYVVRRGEIGRDMFFIARGTLSVLVPDGTKPKEFHKDVSYAKAVSTLKLPASFGDVAIIQDCVRTAWIRADSYALLASLARHDIEGVWKYFPEEREHVVRVVAETAARDKKRQADARKNKFKQATGDKSFLGKLNAQKQKEEEQRKSARRSILEGEEDEVAGVVASNDSTTVEVEDTDPTKQMLTELLKRQTALEEKLDAQSSSLRGLQDLLAPLPAPVAPPRRIRKVKKKREDPEAEVNLPCISLPSIVDTHEPADTV